MGEGEQEGGMDLIKWWWRERREREEGKGKWKTRGAFNRGKKERERVEGIAQNNCQGRPIVEKEERKKRTLSPLCLPLILYILQLALTLKR